MLTSRRPSYYPLPNAWFDLWIDLREATGDRIYAPLKVLNYVMKWTWGRGNVTRPVPFSLHTFQNGWCADGKRLDQGTHLSTSSLLDALDFLTTQGILVESWTEETGVPSFLPSLRPDSDPSVSPPQADVSRTGFGPPEANTFPVPLIWTDLTCDVTSEVLILTVEYFFRCTWGTGGRSKWMDSDDVANGQRPRSVSQERRSKRCDRGIGCPEGQVQDALRDGVSRGLLIWRRAGWGRGREYRLCDQRIDVTADGQWVNPNRTEDAYRDFA